MNSDGVSGPGAGWPSGTRPVKTTKAGRASAFHCMAICDTRLVPVFVVTRVASLSAVHAVAAQEAEPRNDAGLQRENGLLP